jgi:hypothetical protein
MIAMTSVKIMSNNLLNQNIRNIQKLKYESAEDYVLQPKREKTLVELDAEDKLLELEFQKLYGSSKALYQQEYCDKPSANQEISNHYQSRRLIDQARSDSYEYRVNSSIKDYAFARRILYSSRPKDPEVLFTKKSNKKILKVLDKIEGVAPWSYVIDDYKSYYHKLFLKLLKRINEQENRILNQKSIANYLYYILIHAVETRNQIKLSKNDCLDLAERIEARTSKTQYIKFQLIKSNVIRKPPKKKFAQSIESTVISRILDFAQSIDQFLIDQGLNKRQVISRARDIEDIYLFDKSIKGSDYDAEIFILIAILSVYDDKEIKISNLGGFVRTTGINKSNDTQKKIYMKLHRVINRQEMLKELLDRILNRSIDKYSNPIDKAINQMSVQIKILKRKISKVKRKYNSNKKGSRSELQVLNNGKLIKQPSISVVTQINPSTEQSELDENSNSNQSNRLKVDQSIITAETNQSIDNGKEADKLITPTVADQSVEKQLDSVKDINNLKYINDIDQTKQIRIKNDQHSIIEREINLVVDNIRKIKKTIQRVIMRTLLLMKIKNQIKSINKLIQPIVNSLNLDEPINSDQFNPVIATIKSEDLNPVGSTNSIQRMLKIRFMNRVFRRSYIKSRSILIDDYRLLMDQSIDPVQTTNERLFENYAVG